MSFAVTGSAANGTGTAGNGVLLTVKVLTGAAAASAQTGATTSSITANPPQIAITPAATGSWVYGAVGNENGSTDAAFTANGSTTFSANVSDATNFISEGTFRSSSTTTASTPVTLGGTAPTKPCFIVCAEILASGTLAEDASSPAAGANNQAGTSVATASFSPPAGSLLVATLAAHASGGTVVPSVTGGPVTWSMLAADADGATSVWIAQVPAVPLVPAIPAPPAGYAPFPADFTAWVTSPFSFLASPTVLRAELHATTTWTAATNTLVPFDTILEDTWTGWSATSTGLQPANSWLCPAGCSGIYEITMTAWTTSPGSTATDQVQCVLFVDGANYMQASAGWGVNGGVSGSCASVQVPLVGGVDYVQMYVYSQAGTTNTGTAGQYTTMDIAWISTT